MISLSGKHGIFIVLIDIITIIGLANSFFHSVSVIGLISCSHTLSVTLICSHHGPDFSFASVPHRCLQCCQGQSYSKCDEKISQDRVCICPPAFILPTWNTLIIFPFTLFPNISASTSWSASPLSASSSRWHTLLGGLWTSYVLVLTAIPGPSTSLAVPLGLLLSILLVARPPLGGCFRHLFHHLRDKLLPLASVMARLTSCTAGLDFLCLSLSLCLRVCVIVILFVMLFFRKI